MKQAAGSFAVGAGRNQSRQRRIVERAGPAQGAKCVAAALSGTPVSTRINTTCCVAIGDVAIGDRPRFPEVLRAISLK